MRVGGGREGKGEREGRGSREGEMVEGGQGEGCCGGGTRSSGNPICSIFDKYKICLLRLHPQVSVRSNSVVYLDHALNCLVLLKTKRFSFLSMDLSSQPSETMSSC